MDPSPDGRESGKKFGSDSGSIDLSPGWSLGPNYFGHLSSMTNIRALVSSNLVIICNALHVMLTCSRVLRY